MSVRQRKNLQNEESSDSENSSTKRLSPKLPGKGGKEDTTKM